MAEKICFRKFGVMIDCSDVYKRQRKMKKTVGKILALAMGTLIAATCAGCVDFGERENSSSSKEYTGNETEILISVYAAGYGQEMCIRDRIRAKR